MTVQIGCQKNVGSITAVGMELTGPAGGDENTNTPAPGNAGIGWNGLSDRENAAKGKLSTLLSTVE